MVRLVALKSRRFGTARARAGETFHAPRRYARIWKALGLAVDPVSMAGLPACQEPPAAPPETPKGESDRPDLAGYTKAELIEIAEAHDVEVSRHATKAEIVAAITAHWNRQREVE